MLRGDIENGSLSRRDPADFSQDQEIHRMETLILMMNGTLGQQVSSKKQYRITMRKRKELMEEMKRHRIQKKLLPSAPLPAEPGEKQRVVPNSAPGREREGRFRP